MHPLVTFLLYAALSQQPFHSIFDGRSLDGWHSADSTWWSVQDGAITARITPERPCLTNQYLVWQGGALADFELKLKSRLLSQSGINGGFQFRSRVLPDHDVCGYQVDNNLNTPWLARLYDEYGRHTLAWRGERAVFDPNGKRTVTKIPEAAGPAWFRLEDWHEYHLVCVGPTITLRINDRLVAEVEDNDSRRSEPEGLLALQLHSGPPSVVQFKDIRLKILKPAQPTRPSLARVGREKLRRDAVAWWPLDTGGHGAQPPLSHVPAWDKFELNVRPAGARARAHADVVLLDGAYFHAATNLHAGKTGATVYLRARDPLGKWNAALFSKGQGERGHFNLFAADLPPAAGADIAFEVTTERGATIVNFPVSQIDPIAWNDFVGRYDGQTLDLFCNGKRMVSKPCRGLLAQNHQPVLIAAGMENGKPAGHFHGELEEAALWSRPLSDDEIAALSEL